MLLVLGSLFLVGLVACGAAAFIGMRLYRETPRERAGFGRAQVLANLEAPWKRYRFAEVPMEAELPSAPDPEPLEWEQGMGLLYREWISYSASSEQAHHSLVGFWYRTQAFVDVKEDLESLRDDVAADYEGLKSKISARDAAGVRGYELDGTYRYEGEPCRLRIFMWAEGKAILYVLSEFHASAAEGEAEHRRIVESVRMR